MRRGTWFNRFAAEGGALDLSAETREELARLDEKLFAVWNLGDNVLLGWTQSGADLLLLSVRHYVIPESVHAGGGHQGEMSDAMRDAMRDAQRFINEVLSGPKYLKPEQFERVCK